MLSFVALALLVQTASTPIRLDVPVAGLLTDSSGVEPGGRRAEFFAFRCLAGLGLQVDAVSGWDNIAMVIGPDGRIRARDDDGGTANNARIGWTCPDNEVYRIAVASYHYGVGGPFLLTVTATNDVGKPKGIAMIAPDTIVRAMLPRDAPRYLNHPMAMYAFRCRPDMIVSVGMASAFDNMLYLFGPAGLLDWSDDDDGTNATLLFTCHDSEVYRIGAAAREGRDAGPFRLHVRNVRAGGNQDRSPRPPVPPSLR